MKRFEARADLLETLGAVRDELREEIDETNARLDRTNARVGRLGRSVSELVGEVGGS